MKTASIKDSKGNIYPNSIAQVIKIDVNTTKQCLLIRGKNVFNPVILFVHGGPGQAEIAYMKEYQKELEDHFIVVRWDQRGAGLSYSKDTSLKSYTVDTFVSDTIAVTDYLIKRFNKSKIFISGHSWGTIVSTYAVKNYPEKYFAYIGVSQCVNMQEAVNISYQYAYSKAQKQHNEKVLNKLKAIGEPPYSIKEFFTYSECVGRMGGFIKTKPPKSIEKSLFLSKEYPLLDKFRYHINLMRCAKLMYPKIININLANVIKKIDIPVIFISGKHDYNTPIPLVEKFYTNIDAPQKELITFENSAHLPQLEENKLFNEAIINIKSVYS